MTDMDMPQADLPQTETQQGARWVDPAELGLRPDMLVEVMTSDNYLAFLGRVDSIRDGAVILRDNRGNELPQVMYNREMRLSFKREGETTMLRGKICGCSAEIWKLDQLESMFTKDQRSSFRQSVSTSIPAKCHRRSWRGEPEKTGTDCHVIDVSSGGLMFSSGESYEKGDRLALKGVWLVESMDPFNFNCQVRRVGGLEEDGVTRHYGCQFEPMPGREQDRLLRAIFTVQREQIRIHKEKGQL